MNLSPEELEKRLKTLETKLMNLQQELSLTEKIAKQIQGLVALNRFPQIQGVEFLSRYIPGEQNRAEGFDFFLNSQKTTLWFFYFSVQSYGLSTALFQAYLLLQGRTFFDQGKNTPAQALAAIQAEFDAAADPKSRIFIASLHLSTLKWEEATQGEAPCLYTRTSEHNRWGTPKLVTGDERKKLHLSPGMRLFFLNRTLQPTSLKSLEAAPSSVAFKDDFNSMLFQFEKGEKTTKAPQDICFWGLDISAKKIHLA